VEATKVKPVSKDGTTATTGHLHEQCFLCGDSGR